MSRATSSASSRARAELTIAGDRTGPSPNGSLHGSAKPDSFLRLLRRPHSRPSTPFTGYCAGGTELRNSSSIRSRCFAGGTFWGPVVRQWPERERRLLEVASDPRREERRLSPASVPAATARALPSSSSPLATLGSRTERARLNVPTQLASTAQARL